MKLIEVKSVAQEKEWIQFPIRLYQNDPLYIRPIDAEIKEVFDKEKNRTYSYDKSEAVRWTLEKDGITIGRIAAFVNGKTCDTEDQPVGGCGFFDCIDDQEAANLLFDTAKNWLAERKMEAMDGPVNFGERDKNWGVLIDGFVLLHSKIVY